MTRREEVITTLLERYHELVEPLNGPSSLAGSGERVPLMPPTYTPSVRELERLMQRMRSERRSQWWHVSERYMRCEVVAKNGRYLRGKFVNVPPNESVVAKPQGWQAALMEEQSKKRRTPMDVPITVARWSPKVRAEKVRRGIAWLADEWPVPPEPMLPEEIRVAA